MSTDKKNRVLLWGSNPQPSAHGTNAQNTELMQGDLWCTRSITIFRQHMSSILLESVTSKHLVKHINGVQGLLVHTIFSEILHVW